MLGAMPGRPAAARPPRLASDVARSWVALAAWTPIIAGLPWLIALLPVFDDETLAESLIASISIAWTVFCLVMVALTVATFRRASGSELRAWLDATAAPRTRGRRLWWSFNGGGAIWWALTGSAVALYILFELALSGRGANPLFVIAGVTVVPASIAVIIVGFAVSHARRNTAGDLRFPETPLPTFVDYLYLSVQLTTTFGTSDVLVTSTAMRRAVAFHSILAFTFNAVIIALLVSVLLNSVR